MKQCHAITSDLSFNPLKTAPGGLFTTLTTLSSLYFDHSHMSTVPSGLFAGMPALLNLCVCVYVCEGGGFWLSRTLIHRSCDHSRPRNIVQICLNLQHDLQLHSAAHSQAFRAWSVAVGAPRHAIRYPEASTPRAQRQRHHILACHTICWTHKPSLHVSSQGSICL